MHLHFYISVFGTPIYLIDGFLISKFEVILNINVEDIESIHTSYKLTNRDSSLGPIAQHGIFSVITKRGDFIPDHGYYSLIKGLKK